MSGKKYIIPVALAIGAVSMVGLQAFAQTVPTATPTQSVAHIQSVVQPDDQKKGADVEAADDASAAISDTDTETNDGPQAAQSDMQDPTQTDGETSD